MSREAQGHSGKPAGDAAGARSAHASSLDAWVLATLPRALAYATGLLADRDAAEDVVHDCYCRLLQKQNQYDLSQDGAKLLFRSITNACIDRSRRRANVSLFSADVGDDESSGMMMELADERTPEPWQRMDHAELQRRVTEGLEKLPPVQRAALELKSLGHSLQEIAEALQVTPTNAGVLIHRARQSLGKHLGQGIETNDV